MAGLAETRANREAKMMDEYCIVVILFGLIIVDSKLLKVRREEETRSRDFYKTTMIVDRKGRGGKKGSEGAFGVLWMGKRCE